MKNNDPYGKKKIKFLEHVNEIELVAGIVAIAVALVYEGIFVAIAVAIGVIFLESIILVEISTAKNVAKLRQQNERIESYLKAIHDNNIQNLQTKPPSIEETNNYDEYEKKDLYKWHKIVAWSVFFIAITFLINHFFG